MSGLQFLKRNTPPTYLMFTEKDGEPLLVYYHDDLGKLKEYNVFKNSYSIYRYAMTIRCSTQYESCEFESELYDKERYNLLESVGKFYKHPGPYCIVFTKWFNKEFYFPK